MGLMALSRKAAWLATAAVLTCLLVPSGVASASDTEVKPAAGYAEVSAKLSEFIRQEMADKKLPAFSIALVEDQEIVWAQAFGNADPDKKIAATAGTVYRIGSVSKLFTDIGVMQLVERGQLDLDAPIQKYLPDFHPQNPFHKDITLRELMSHRSGLLREPPVGNYFEDANASLAATIASLNQTKLVYEPGTYTKYSNAGVATVGYVLEKRSGEPFARYLQHAVLDPMGLEDSSFEPTPALQQKLAKAYMWSYDGKEFAAPTFELGMSPAGCMYSTVLDLGRFLSVLFHGGQGPHGQVLKPESLQQMWTPQFAKPGQTEGFGLGFHLAKLDGHRAVGHGGAIYGFATELAGLPDDKLGVVTVTTVDAANTVTNNVAAYALRLMLARREGKPLPDIPKTAPIPPQQARELEGRYGTGDAAVDLIDQNNEVFLLPVAGGEQVRLRQSGDSLIEDGRIGYGGKIATVAGGIRVEGKDLQKVAAPKPAPIPARWKGLIGEYGWDYDTLYIFEKDSRLTALIEWFEYAPLQEASKDVFNFPHSGLYDGEQAVFTRDAQGNATQVKVSGVVFKRRPLSSVSNGIFRVQPLESVAVLRRKALAAQPPQETGEFRKPDLVEPTSLDPGIKLDIRYATKNDFLGTPVYSQAKAFLQRPAAEAVARVNRKLRPYGFGILIHDAYRPWYVTKIFWDATPLDKRIFVADPNEGSRHNRGCAVDLTFYDLATGKEVVMPGVYDEMSERSYAFYPGGTSEQRARRDLLRRAMEEEGFDVYLFEWWHFDYKDWRHYPILNLTFDQLLASPAAAAAGRQRR